MLDPLKFQPPRWFVPKLWTHQLSNGYVHGEQTPDVAKVAEALVGVFSEERFHKYIRTVSAGQREQMDREFGLPRTRLPVVGGLSSANTITYLRVTSCDEFGYAHITGLSGVVEKFDLKPLGRNRLYSARE